MYLSKLACLALISVKLLLFGIFQQQNLRENFETITDKESSLNDNYITDTNVDIEPLMQIRWFRSLVGLATRRMFDNKMVVVYE